jgi:hypothetical protein
MGGNKKVKKPSRRFCKRCHQMYCCEMCDRDRSAIAANTAYTSFHMSMNISGAFNPFAPHDLGPYCARLGCVTGSSCPFAAIVDARNRESWTKANEDPEYSLDYEQMITDLKRRFATKGSLIATRDATLDDS